MPVYVGPNMSGTVVEVPRKGAGAADLCKVASVDGDIIHLVAVKRVRPHNIPLRQMSIRRRTKLRLHEATNYAMSLQRRELRRFVSHQFL